MEQNILVVPDGKISDYIDGIGQLKSYMSACVNCEWGMWTNGRQKEVLRKCIDEKGHADFIDRSPSNRYI